MPRRRQDQAVAERAAQMLAERAERRREAARRAAQTRRQRREQQRGEPPAQAAAERRTRAQQARRSRPRAHPEMLTAAIRGPLAAKMRQLAENAGLSLAKLLGDMVLVYEERIDAGYEPGTSLQRWEEGEGAAASRTSPH